jgi:hypothetical protein
MQESMGPPTPEVPLEEEKSGNNFTRNMMYVVAGLAALILLVFVIGLAFALLAPPQATALRFGMVRDVLLIILVMEGILIFIALTVLVLQIARLAGMLQNEVRPILDDSKETVGIAKDTAQFVGSNVATPLIRMKAFWAGLVVFMREILGIRRAIKKRDRSASDG